MTLYDSGRGPIFTTPSTDSTRKWRKANETERLMPILSANSRLEAAKKTQTKALMDCMFQTHMLHVWNICQHLP